MSSNTRGKRPARKPAPRAAGLTAGAEARPAGAHNVDKYRPSFAKQAYQLCLLGLTDAQLAKVFGVSRPVIITGWRARYPEFDKALTEGRRPADAKVAQALFDRARGYTVDVKKVVYDKGTPVVVTVSEHVPADVNAIKFWLSNRQRELWRDVQRSELTGANGGPIQTEKTASPRDEIERRLAGMRDRMLAESNTHH